LEGKNVSIKQKNFCPLPQTVPAQVFKAEKGHSADAVPLFKKVLFSPAYIS